MTLLTMTIEEGKLVKYKDYVGRIKFISPEYLTICNPGLRWDICVVVYSEDFHLIHEVPSDV
jgi:hypothetical protein